MKTEQGNRCAEQVCESLYRLALDTSDDFFQTVIGEMCVDICEHPSCTSKCVCYQRCIQPDGNPGNCKECEIYIDAFKNAFDVTGAEYI